VQHWFKVNIISKIIMLLVIIGFAALSVVPFLPITVVHDESSGEQTAYQDYDSDTHEEETEPEDPHPGYTMHHLDAADIHRGHLLLINPDYAVTISEEINLSYIVNVTATPNTRVELNSFQLARSIIPALDEMMDAFVEATGNTNIGIISAFRSYEAQRTILDQRIADFGYEEAHRMAARPGYSEHHTGLAIDFGVLHADGTRTTFTGTGDSAWFAQNSYRFGFIVRYPEEKTEITRVVYEPWHFRYVGIPHAQVIRQNDWVLEEYIDALRNHTEDHPLIVVADSVVYEIFFTQETDILIPTDSQYSIQGNNIDGFIVTLIR